jgi:hypothetical protein
MAFTEAGTIHRDISPYNLLLVNPEKHYEELRWLEPVKDRPNPDVWTRTAKGTHHAAVDNLPNPRIQEE